MQSDAQIVITVPREVKGAWVEASRAQGLKLTDWIISRVEAFPDFDGFSLNIAALLPFEAYVRALSDDDAHSLFVAVKELDAQQDEAIVAIKVARSYLEKRVAIANRQADRALFLDINVWALDYYYMHPTLTHSDLIEVLAA